MDQEKSTGDALDRLSRKVTVLGGIIAAFVGMNAALTTCSNESIARYAGFRKAVDAEEMFWRDRFNDYLGVFKADVPPAERKARLYALSALTQREVPRFQEYRLGWIDDEKEKELAFKRLTAMRLRLNEALDREQSSDKDLAQERQQQNLAAGEATAIRPRSGTEVTEASQAVTAQSVAEAPVAGVTYRTQILSAGDPKGWDVDTFWCSGGDSASESRNYSRGLRIAQKLAGAAAARTEIAPGVRLGRIRFLALPDSRHGGIYPVRGSGTQMRFEAQERAAANSVFKLVGGEGDIRGIQSDTRTPWYFSFFSCAAGTPSAGTPGANSGTPAAL